MTTLAVAKVVLAVALPLLSVFVLLGFILGRAGSSCAFGPAVIEWSWQDFSYMCVTPSGATPTGPGTFGVVLVAVILLDAIALHRLSREPKPIAQQQKPS